ncbi:MAG: ATP-binding protein [Gemmatimonadota bacterium]
MIDDSQQPHAAPLPEEGDGVEVPWSREPRFCLLEVLTDTRGRPHDCLVLQSSPAMDRHLEVESAAGMRLREIVPDTPEEWFELYARVARTGRSLQFVRPSPLHDTPMEVTVVPAGPPGSGQVAVLALVVGERKRIEAELRRAVVLLEGIAEGTGDLIAAEDRDFRYTYFNEAYRREFARLWGHELRMGDSMIELMADWPVEQRKARELWQRALDGETYRTEMSFGPTPEERRIYDLRFSPVRDDRGRIVGAAHIFRDVTARARAEDALRDADRRKDEFLALLGHELRNPLAAIRHATDVLRDMTLSDEDRRRVLDTLERQSKQMGGLVDGLLEISRVVSGKITLEPEPLDLRRIVAEVVNDQVGRYAESDVTVERSTEDGPVKIQGDRLRIGQIVDNLLMNAVKFTDPGGRVSVEVDVEGPDAVLRVRDTGAGIDRERLERIFEPFHQETADRQDGLGLGLSLSRALAELHGGSLVARSEGPGHGSEFILRLPRLGGTAGGDAAPEAKTEPAAAVEDGGGLRLLLVEDHLDAAEMLTWLLESKGHTATAVATGAEALEALEQQRIDYVLSDIGLPDMSGYDLARRILGDPRWSGIGLIAVTGFGQASDRERSLEAGFDAHLTKPVNLQDIQEVLRNLEQARR